MVMEIMVLTARKINLILEMIRNLKSLAPIFVHFLLNYAH